MSNLRIIGLFIGITGLFLTFAFYRGPRWNRSTFLFLSFFNICLALVAINPNVVNFARDLLALQKYQYGRIIALLILSIIFLMLFSFFTQSKLEKMRLQFDKLVRKLGQQNLYDDRQVREKIKPIMILLPALNEERNLIDLLPRMPRTIQGLEVGVLVVDDGSEDRTKDIVTGRGYLAVSNMINRGGGAALRLGYDILQKERVEICVTMDADGQHLPEEIESLVLPILNDQYDVVIGSRVIGNREKDNLFRLIGVHLFSRIISLLLGRKITDPSSGFRAFRLKAIAMIQLYEDQYHTSELIIDAVKKNLRLGEIPVTIKRRASGKSRKGKDWIYGFQFARTIIKTWWR